MSWPEILLALAFLLLVANAARRGFLREGSLLVGLAAGLWLAGRLYRQVEALLPVRVEHGPWSILVYLGLALALLVVAVALSALASPLVRRGPLQVVDRLAGLGVGLAEATMVVGLLATAGERLGAVHVPPHGPAARAMELAGVGLAWLSATIPAEILTLARIQA